MDEHDDFEERLLTFRHETGPHVKRSVMEAFRRRQAAGASRPIWRRSVPLYAVVALIVLAAGLTWALARSPLRSGAGAGAGEGPPAYTAAAADLTGTAAERDQI